MDNIIFELKNIDFSYLGKYPALRGININIRQGEKITIIGANGSGKSTLLHMLDGLIFPDKGIVKAFGKELKESDFANECFSRNFRMKVGLVFQNPDVQLFCPTVKEDIIFGPLQLGVEKKEIEKRLEEVLSILEIKDLLHRSPHQLSVGEKKKVAIASILAINPEILLLDEPTAGLDPRTSRELIDLIAQYHQQGKTIITATHDLHLVAEISTSIYILNEEKTIVAFGNSEEILSNQDLLLKYNLVHIHKHKHGNAALHEHPHQHTALNK